MTSMHNSHEIDIDDDVWNILHEFRDEKCDGDDANVCCKSPNVILIDGNYTCTNCYTLVSRFIDTTAEWRFYGCEDNKGSDPTRCGLPVSELLPDSSLGSVIGYGTNESHDIRIMRRYHLWNCMPYKERSLYCIFETLTTAAKMNDIPHSIIEEAKSLYKKISELSVSRGENRNGLIASSLFMSCKLNHVSRSAKEIAGIFHMKVSTMTRGCKKFQEIMKVNTKSTTPEDFINRFCSYLHMDKSMREICKVVAKAIAKNDLVSENTPPSVAAGTIYLCNITCGWGYTKKQLSDKCTVSQVTIGKVFHKLDRHRFELFREIAETYNIVIK